MCARICVQTFLHVGQRDLSGKFSCTYPNVYYIYPNVCTYMCTNLFTCWPKRSFRSIIHIEMYIYIYVYIPFYI